MAAHLLPASLFIRIGELAQEFTQEGEQEGHEAVGSEPEEKGQHTSSPDYYSCN